ncbi:SCO0607 family lipoprotein [Streptomyces avermitilis]|uniref:SCO0607 family lipoprotein n=1 Tax=Streptomyces avermitilis TaxID=33903 RepID=UPI00369E0A79
MRKNSRSRAVLALAALSTAVLATGCSAEDAICGSGEYPVKAVGGKTGQACVADDENPPKGYVRYPKDRTPAHVGDKWDEYWSTVVVDSDGNIVKK